jgi:hypothetical protein
MIRRGPVDIWIVSFQRDYEWLRFCVRGIAKYFTGWRVLHIALPPDAPDPGVCLPFVRHAEAPGFADGYIGQQVTKLRAYRETNAEWIAFLDSDHVAFKPVDVADYFDAGRPQLWWRSWGDVARLPSSTTGEQGVTCEAERWRKIAERALGWDPPLFTLEFLPMIFHRDTLAACCEQVWFAHAIELEQFSQRQPWREFSEFVMLGNMAFEHHSSAYSWRRVSASDVIDYRFRGFSPYSGVTAQDRAWCEDVLR